MYRVWAGAYRNQKRKLGSLELGFYVVVGSGNWTWVLCKTRVFVMVSIAVKRHLDHGDTDKE